MGGDFDGAGTKAGLEVWRIEKLVPTLVKPKFHGHFFEGDAYIVLKTSSKPQSSSLIWDIFFWLGKECSTDEAGVAALKTVELDESLGGGPVQHREVQDCESLLFLSYFPEGLTYLAGGTESGFRHVEHFARPPTLLWVKGLVNDVLLTEVDVHRHSMNSGDVFVLDCDEGIFQWNGRDSNGYERARAAEVCATMHAERGKSKVR